MNIRTVFATSICAAAAVVAVAATPATAATIITTSAGFAAATSAPGVDTYTGFSITGTTASPLTRTAGAYTYTAAASTSTFFGAGTSANPWLSTNLATDSVTFSGFASNVRGVGGNFFGSDINGAYLLGNITLTLIDSAGTTTYTINGATTASFVGFVSTGPITSLTISAVQTALPLWPTIDNLTIAQAPAAGVVPEPATWALMLAGFGMVGFSLRRRAKVSTAVTFA